MGSGRKSKMWISDPVLDHTCAFLNKDDSELKRERGAGRDERHVSVSDSVFGDRDTGQCPAMPL